MSSVFEIEKLEPSLKLRVLADLYIQFMTVWGAMARMDWTGLALALDELERRASIAVLDNRAIAVSVVVPAEGERKTAITAKAGQDWDSSTPIEV